MAHFLSLEYLPLTGERRWLRRRIFYRDHILSFSFTFLFSCFAITLNVGLLVFKVCSCFPFENSHLGLCHSNKKPLFALSYHSTGWRSALSALWCVGASSGTVEGLLVTMDLGLGGTTLGLGGTTAQLPRSAEV